jgi:hypothetical protein
VSLHIPLLDFPHFSPKILDPKAFKNNETPAKKQMTSICDLSPTRWKRSTRIFQFICLCFVRMLDDFLGVFAFSGGPLKIGFMIYRPTMLRLVRNVLKAHVFPHIRTHEITNFPAENAARCVFMRYTRENSR